MAEIVVFATVEDLSERTGKDYEGDTLTRAQTLLEDASACLLGLGFDANETDPVRLHLARAAVCNAVSYKLERDATYESVKQATQTAGPYTQSVTFATPSGSMRFLKQDLMILGLGSTRYRSLQPHMADLREEGWTCL